MKKRLTALLVGAALLLGGCGVMRDGLPMDERPVGGPDAETGDAGMGRYVETVTNLSETTGTPMCLAQLSNGDLVVVGMNAVKALSHDNGATWEQESIAGFEGMLGKADYFIVETAVSPDGTIVLAYLPMEAAGTGPYYLSVLPDGTQRDFTIEPAAGEEYAHRFFFDDAGQCYASMYGTGGNVYEVDLRTGDAVRVLRLAGGPVDNIQFMGSRMFLCQHDGVVIYDRETGTYIEDEVINDFVREQYGALEDHGGYSDQYLFSDGGEAVYIGGQKGLHRHVIGGTAVEQVIDGALSGFGDPSRGIREIVALENQEFVALFSDGKVVRFAYAPDTPTVPEEKLVVYSLRQNDTVQQAVSLYRAAHAGVNIEYRVGMGEEDAVTREDALKKLNTELMSGEGPDVLILDNMPMDSYVEKRLLLDIHDVADEMEAEDGLFTNLIAPFYQGDALYMIPCEIRLPVIAGQRDAIARMSGMEAAADVVEQMRRENPDKAIFRVYSPKGMMKLFALVSAPAWKKADGTPDMEQIGEFLTQTRRIYHAQMENAQEELVSEYMALNEGFESGSTFEDSDSFDRAMDGVGFLYTDMQMDMGTLYAAYESAELLSMPKASGFETYAVLPAQGQRAGVYIPGTLAGVNASCADTAAAKEFLRYMLGGRAQTMLHGGLPINEAAFEAVFAVEENHLGEENRYGSLTSTMGDLSVTMIVYWPNAEELDEVREWMRDAGTPYLYDAVLEEAVYAAGTAYFQGECGLEAALDMIEEKVAVYAAE